MYNIFIAVVFLLSASANAYSAAIPSDMQNNKNQVEIGATNQSKSPVLFTGIVESEMINGCRVFILLSRDHGAPGKLILGNMDETMNGYGNYYIAEAASNKRPFTIRTNYTVGKDGTYYISNPREAEPAKPEVSAPVGLLEKQVAAHKDRQLIELEDFVKEEKNFFSGKYESKHYLKITALMDNVTVSGVIVNQGNRIYSPALGGIPPLTINYGESILMFDDPIALFKKRSDKQNYDGLKSVSSNYFYP